MFRLIKHHKLRCESIRLLCTNRQRPVTHWQIRSTFLEYFKSKQHHIVPSSSILAPPETGLLFTNAGMNQFVNILSGRDRPAHPRIANIQYCVRVGGKHNDLFEVGHDGHHHTFFEMMGNWSFGDYFKMEACSYALDLLVNGYKMDKDKLIITYFGGDKKLGLEEDLETKEIWLSLGVSKDNVLPRGVTDNFWEMGATGPCGPCTELHIMNDNMLREIWNLVFIQYNRLSDGALHPLKVPFVDTGLGLERLCCVLQERNSNYDTDLFLPIIMRLEKECKGSTYVGSYTRPEDVAYRIVADHLRMVTVALSQGVLPDHRDAGNKLRRVLRRAIHNAREKLLLPQGELAAISDSIAEYIVTPKGTLLGKDVEAMKLVKEMINEEEDRYMKMLGKAKNIISVSQNSSKSRILSGTVAWDLYLKCGLSKESIADLVHDFGFEEIDWKAFNEHLKEFKEKSNTCDCLSVLKEIPIDKIVHELKNNNLKPTQSDAIYDNCYDLNSTLDYIWTNGSYSVLVTKETCLYPEGGGQRSDSGSVVCKGKRCDIIHVCKEDNFILVVIDGALEDVQIGDSVTLHVDRAIREACARHHTATHLLNAAVKKLYGKDAHQNSSYVDQNYFKLDVVSRKPLDVEELETRINDYISANYSVDTKVVHKSVVFANDNITKLPNEVYPENLRLVTCGEDVSMEPCCGTHVRSTGDISRVVILSSKSQGVNIKSITGTASQALEAIENATEMSNHVNLLTNAASEISATRFDHINACRKDLKRLRQTIAETLLPHVQSVKLSHQLNECEKHLEKLTKLHSKENSAKVTELLSSKISSLPQDVPLVTGISFDCDTGVFYRALRAVCRDRAYFAALNACGSVQVECHVPQKNEENNLTAVGWCTKVMSHFDGVAKIGAPNKVSPNVIYRLRLDNLSDLEDLLGKASAVLEKDRARPS